MPQLTVAYAGGWPTEIRMARRFAEGEGLKYNQNARELAFVAVGDAIELKHISLKDIVDELDDRQSDGMFLGCANIAWVISEAEGAALQRLNEKKALVVAQIAAQKEQDERAYAVAMQSVRGLDEVIS